MKNSKLDHNGWFKEIIKDVLEERMDERLVSGVIQNDGKIITDLPASHNVYFAKPKIEESKKTQGSQHLSRYMHCTHLQRW